MNNMAATPDQRIAEVSEVELMVEEFRQKLVVSIKKERERSREIAEKEAKLILTKAYQDAAGVTSASQEEAKQIIAKAREQADQEADALISRTQAKVEQIIRNAEEVTRKEAKERTKKEVDSIINNAKEEASKTSAKILQTAKDEASNILLNAKNDSALISNKMISDAKIEASEVTKTANELRQRAAKELENTQKKAEETARKILMEVRGTALEKAEKEGAEIIAQAKFTAQKERELLLATTLEDGKRSAEIEASHIIIQARQEAEIIVNTAKEKVKAQLEDSSRLMMEIQQKMHQVIGTAGLDIETPKHSVERETQQFATPPSSPIRKEEKPAREPRLETRPESRPEPEHRPEPKPVYSVPREQTHRVVNEMKTASSSLADNENPTYQGRLKIDIAPPVDNDQLNNLEQNLQKNPNIQVLVKGGAEDGSAWIEIELSKPMTLLDILRKLPGVKDVVGAKSYIIVALKSRQLV
jgi:vacuolar-type H+-ATPase subunit H